MANHHLSTCCVLLCTGTSVFKVTALDADDPTYGNSAKIVYSILEGQPNFSVDPKTGKTCKCSLEEVLTADQVEVQRQVARDHLAPAVE